MNRRRLIMMKALRNFSRIFVGIVFVFSGFVKGVDPLGTAYRIEDYLIAYGMHWALPLTLFASISLSALEFLLGAVLILNLRIKPLSWILFLLMIFFTLLTFYDALYEPVPDCGCFGDAIKLTNWETFYKNLVLIVFVGVVFFNRKKYKPSWNIKTQHILIIGVTFGFIAFSYLNYQYLPVIDFREWKVGNDVVPEDRGEAKIYLTYRNIETGEEKEYLSPNYPWDDSVWMSKWKFVDQRIDDSEVVRGHELVIEDQEGMDVTDVFIENPDYQLLVISYDLKQAKKRPFKKLNEIFQKAEHEGVSMVILTSTLPSDVEKYRDLLATHLEVYQADDIILKTMIRSNPGLMLMKDGVVLGKWHYNNLPDFADLEDTYFTD